MAIGRIGKPHGLRGWVTVTPTTDEPEWRFAPDQLVIVGGVQVQILDSRIGRPLTVHLSGVDDRDAAEALRGQWLYVDPSDDPVPEDDGEFYDHQLEGLAVRVDGTEMGRVSQVLHLPGQDVLVVRTDDGREVLVPFVERIVPGVDLPGGFIDVSGEEGLFDDED